MSNCGCNDNATQCNGIKCNVVWYGAVYVYIYVYIYICIYIYVCTLNPCNYMRWRVHRHVFCHLIFFGHWLSEKQFRQRPDMYFDMSTDMYSDISACWPTLVLIRILTPTLTLYIYIYMIISLYIYISCYDVLCDNISPLKSVARRHAMAEMR